MSKAIKTLEKHAFYQEAWEMDQLLEQNKQLRAEIVELKARIVDLKRALEDEKDAKRRAWLERLERADKSTDYE